MTRPTDAAHAQPGPVLGQHAVQPVGEADAASEATAAMRTGPAPVGQVAGQPASQSVSQHVSAAIATAKAAAVAQSRAVAAAAAAPAQVAPPSPPPGPREGTVYGRAEARGAALLGRHSRLRIGWHTASPAALAAMDVPSPSTGLILGADHLKQSVPVRFFRAEPTRVSLVGGVWSAQMLAFRALALGAQVIVMTIEPQAWQNFSQHAASPPGRVLVLHGEQAGSAVGTANQPVLIVHDLGLTGPTTPPTIGPWQTHLTVLRRLDERGVPYVQRCDLLILQRLHPTEAAQAETALRLKAESARLLQMMEDEMLALIGGGANRYLWLQPTAVERQLMGAAWR